MSDKRVKPGGTLIACSTHGPAEVPALDILHDAGRQHVHPRPCGTSSRPTGRAPLGLRWSRGRGRRGRSLHGPKVRGAVGDPCGLLAVFDGEVLVVEALVVAGVLVIGGDAVLEGLGVAVVGVRRRDGTAARLSETWIVSSHSVPSSSV